MKKYTGTLIYNKLLDRVDVVYNDGTNEGGLHCGVCFDVKVSGKYKPTRIEKSDEWYLVDTDIYGIDNLVGLKVRSDFYVC